MRQQKMFKTLKNCGGLLGDGRVPQVQTAGGACPNMAPGKTFGLAADAAKLFSLMGV
jgi:hypothetical protein